MPLILIPSPTTNKRPLLLNLLRFLHNNVLIVQNLRKVSELLISHLIDLVDFLLEVELIVLLADVGVVLLDGLLDVGLALFHDLDVLGFGFGCVVEFSQLLSDLFECPCAGWAHVAFCYGKMYSLGGAPKSTRSSLGRRTLGSTSHLTIPLL